MVTAAQNPNGSISVVVFNQGTTAKNMNLSLKDKSTDISINAQAIQTIVIP